MNFRYNGDKKKMVAYGYDFSDKRVVNVPESDELAIRKFTGNSHFDRVERVKKKKAK